MDPESLYAQLGRLVETIPSDLNARPMLTSTRQWLGRACALVDFAGTPFDASDFRSAIRQLSAVNVGASYFAAEEIATILHRVLAIAELKAPVSARGAFIPAGNAFDALAAISKSLSGAERDVLFVDPYMDEKALTDFAPLASEKVGIRLLADQQSHKATLRPAFERWRSQYGDSRPLAARLAPPRTLHDRLIMLDGSQVWILTQSLKDFAARSPASIVRADGDAAALKVSAYQGIWDAATPIS
jgi:hypothetical protein